MNGKPYKKRVGPRTTGYAKKLLSDKGIHYDVEYRGRYAVVIVGPNDAVEAEEIIGGLYSPPRIQVTVPNVPGWTIPLIMVVALIVGGGWAAGQIKALPGKVADNATESITSKIQALPVVGALVEVEATPTPAPSRLERMTNGIADVLAPEPAMSEEDIARIVQQTIEAQVTPTPEPKRWQIWK